jgi:hypothetical protein
MLRLDRRCLRSRSDREYRSSQAMRGFPTRRLPRTSRLRVAISSRSRLSGASSRRSALMFGRSLNLRSGAATSRATTKRHHLRTDDRRWMQLCTGKGRGLNGRSSERLAISRCVCWLLLRLDKPSSECSLGCRVDCYALLLNSAVPPKLSPRGSTVRSRWDPRRLRPPCLCASRPAIREAQIRMHT